MHMNNSTEKHMESKDLIIRESRYKDLDLFHQWEKMPEVTKFFSISDDQTEEDVYHKFFIDSDDPAVEQFTILLKDDSGQKEDGGEPKTIGRIVLGDIIPEWKAEIWRIYVGDTALRGKGYGRQAMELMMDYCFNELKLERLYLDHYTGNPAAYLYKNLGFKEEGVLRNNCRKNGVLYDVHLMSMLREEYEDR